MTHHPFSDAMECEHHPHRSVRMGALVINDSLACVADDYRLSSAMAKAVFEMDRS